MCWWKWGMKERWAWNWLIVSSVNWWSQKRSLFILGEVDSSDEGEDRSFSVSGSGKSLGCLPETVWASPLVGWGRRTPGWFYRQLSPVLSFSLCSIRTSWSMEKERKCKIFVIFFFKAEKGILRDKPLTWSFIFDEKWSINWNSASINRPTKMSRFLISAVIFLINLKGKTKKRERSSLCCFIPQTVTKPALGQADARSQERQAGPTCGWQGPKHWNSPLPFSQTH